MKKTTNDLARSAAQYQATILEGGEGYNPFQAELDRRELEASAALAIKLTEAKQLLAAEWTAEWTAEVTLARRAEWNQRILSGEFGDHTDAKSYDRKAAAIVASNLGWSLSDLSMAVKANNLPAYR